MTKALPWFRFYTESIDDEKLGLLAFEDRWHFVALLCLKGKGVLDDESDAEMLARKVALKMGLTLAELEKVVGRLARMGLIDKDTFQPRAWDSRQMKSDSSAERVQAYRERQKWAKRAGNVTVTAQEEDTDTDTEKEKEKKTVAKAPDLSDVPPEILSDYKKHRAAKKAPLTKTAVDGLRREAAEAGLTLAEVMQLCCERGWQGFKAEWLTKESGARKPADIWAGAIN